MTADAIRFGTIAPFTGPAALRGNGPRMVGGTKAWLDLFNEAGGVDGRRVELMVEDSAYDIDVSRAAVRKLVEEDKVLALVNANGTPQLTAALPYIEEQRMPLLMPFGGDKPWYYPPRHGVLGVQPPFDGVGHLLGQWAARDGWKRPVIFYPHYPEVMPDMAREAARGFQESSPTGREPQTVMVQLASEDGEAMADAIVGHDPDAIIVLTNFIELFALQRVLRARGAEFPLYSWTANVTGAIADLGGDLIEGMNGYAATMVGPDADLPIVNSYRDAMARACPGQEPDFLSLTAFAHAMIVTDALDLAGPEAGVGGLLDAFYAKTFETGILPPMRFSPNRHLGVDRLQPMCLKERRWQPLGALHELPGFV